MEPAELGAARGRLAQARAHLDSPPAQPYAWLAEWPPAVAGAMLRDLPTERLEPVRGALLRLAEAAGWRSRCWRSPPAPAPSPPSRRRA